MYRALKRLHDRVVAHLANLSDKQPWENKAFMEHVEKSIGELLAVFPPPETFAGGTVIGSLKLADDPSECPHKYVIVTRQGDTFNVNTIAHNGVAWASGWQGYYGMSWERALARFTEAALRYGPGVLEGVCPVTRRINCADRECELHYMDAPVKLAPEPDKSQG